MAHPALSEFRIQGLMQKFQQNQLPVKSVYAEYLHFVELNRPLVSEQEAKLKALLHYEPWQNTMPKAKLLS